MEGLDRFFKVRGSRFKVTGPETGSVVGKLRRSHQVHRRPLEHEALGKLLLAVPAGELDLVALLQGDSDQVGHVWRYDLAEGCLKLTAVLGEPLHGVASGCGREGNALELSLVFAFGIERKSTRLNSSH